MTGDTVGLDHCRVRVAVLAFFGFRQGFIVGVLSFGGFALGAFLGTRLGPLLLPQGSSSPYAPAFGLVGALLGGAILASGLEGLGFRLRRTLIMPGMGLLDGAARSGARRGARRSAIVWIAAAVAAQTPGQSQLRADIQRSAILRKLNEVLPPSGPILNALARLDPLPSITGPLARRRARPSRAIARTPGVRARLAQRRARDRHGLRAGDRGLRLGGRAGRGRDQRARGRRRAGHDRRGRRATRPSLPAAADRVRPHRRHRGAARARSRPARR